MYDATGINKMSCVFIMKRLQNYNYPLKVFFLRWGTVCLCVCVWAPLFWFAEGVKLPLPYLQPVSQSHCKVVKCFVLHMQKKRGKSSAGQMLIDY